MATSTWGAPNITSILERYNLTTLLPLATIFLLAVVVYVINRVIFGIAALLPINIGYTGDRLERMLHEDPSMQKHLKRYLPFSGFTLVEFALAKARSQKEEALLRNIDNAQKATGRNNELFTFAKFLLAWTVACSVFSMTVRDATTFTYSRLSLLLFTVIVLGIYAACKFAKSVEYLVYAQVNTVRIVLMNESESPIKTSDPTDDEIKEDAMQYEQRRMRIEFLRRQRWWYLRLRLMDWWEMLGYYRHYDPGYIGSDKKRLLQAVLRNSANIIWFIFGALLIAILGRFSWWLRSGLFVGYVSITIVNCLLIAFLLGSVTGKLLLSRIRSKLPESIGEFLPAEPATTITVREDHQYLLTLAAVRLVEAVIAVVLCRALANQVFGSG
jgi:hypothetical protein